jgi:hypothetical protein
MVQVLIPNTIWGELRFSAICSHTVWYRDHNSLSNTLGSQLQIPQTVEQRIMVSAIGIPYYTEIIMGENHDFS